MPIILLLRVRHVLLAALLMLGCQLGITSTAHAAEVIIQANDNLQTAINDAQPGDTLLLAAGTYSGNIVIDKPLTLMGPTDRSAIILGDTEGRTLWVKAPEVSLRQLTVRGSGLSLSAMDAAIFLDRGADSALIEQNDILDNLIGVYVWGPKDATVQNNRIVGNSTLRRAERGNGVQLWNTPGSKVISNDIRAGRDGIYVNTSKHNVFHNNQFHDVRFGVHYMYTQDSEVSNNVSVGNDVGYALMFSERLLIKNNQAIDNRDHGLALNAVNRSEIIGNQVLHGEKCVFVYGSNINELHDNRFEACEIGIHFTAGSEQNKMTGNAFINNRTQVMYVGTRYLDWSEGGRGNYWSDNTAFDLNGDGIADVAYRPNNVMDQVLWRAPMAKLLLNSPATQVIKWAQSQFPAIHPGGVVDSAPLMEPPAATRSRFAE